MPRTSGRNSGGGKAEKAPASGDIAHDSPDAGAAPRPIADCPFGIPVEVESADGVVRTAIRHAYRPHWFNETRSAGIPFTPVTWRPLRVE